MGFPQIAFRHPDLVLHTGTVEALPKSLKDTRFIQTSFQSGGGLSGGPLVDERGLVLGLMVENVFMEVRKVGKGKRLAPSRPYGQAVPFEYVARIRTCLRDGGAAALAGSGLTVLERPEAAEAF